MIIFTVVNSKQDNFIAIDKMISVLQMIIVGHFPVSNQQFKLQLWADLLFGASTVAHTEFFLGGVSGSNPLIPPPTCVRHWKIYI